MTTPQEHLVALNVVIISVAHEAQRIQVILNRLLTEAINDQAIDPLTKSQVLDVLHALYSLKSQANLAEGVIQTALLTHKIENGD
jgi:hypothetical protein